MIILVDNYDSFTYNLYQLLREIGEKVVVVRNDEINKEIIQELSPDAIVISPGPCTPNQAGQSMEIIDLFAGKIPILGVCLGHQCIVQVLGGKIIRATKPVHGKRTKIFHNNSGRAKTIGLQSGTSNRAPIGIICNRVRTFKK